MKECAEKSGAHAWQDRALRRESKQLELLWRGAKSYGSSADVFTGNFPNGRSFFTPHSAALCLGLPQILQ